MLLTSDLQINMVPKYFSILGRRHDIEVKIIKEKKHVQAVCKDFQINTD